MKAPLFLVVLLISFASAAAKPNVLLIVSEDNSEQIGCYGEKRVHTPHLDGLAEGGVRYERAYVPYSVCSPSRSAFLTGLYPRQTGHIGLATHRFSFYRDFKTMPAYLKEAGYYTGFIGKTHVNPESVVEDHVDFRGIKTANFNNTFSIEDYAREARTVFENAVKAKKPFLCILNYSDAHRRFVGKSKAGYPTVPVTGDIEPLPWFGVDTPHLREEMRNYLNCMNRLDEGIGLVLDGLEELKQRDNTLVIYIADHGADFMRAKTSCYEAGVKVPMIVNHPKSFPKGRVERALVSTMDILPTVLREIGVPIPGELVGTPLQDLLNPKSTRRRYIHTFNTGSAASLLYLTFGIRDDRHKLIYNPVRDRNLAGISRYQNSRVPKELWRADYVNPPEFELYDLVADPYELSNLAGLAKQQTTKDRLFAAMREFQKEIDDPFLDSGNVDYFIREQKDPQRQPSKRSQETWGHLKKFWPRPNVSFAVAKVFSDGMVLPRDRRVPVWGKAKPGSEILVSFRGQKARAVADATGNWQAILPPFPASAKPADLTINDLTIHDVLVGDVWICSGQSNMRWMLEQSKDAKEHIAAANDDQLRLLDLTGKVYPNSRAYDLATLRQTTGKNYYTWSQWRRSSPESAAGFSAVAYHFGRRLRELNPDVPVGLIHNSIGGTPMESWIPESVLLSDPELRVLVTEPWHSEDHPRYPKWCGLRGRQNLKQYFDQPDGPVPNHPFKPGFLFDAGVAPFVGLPIQGVIWYQGESNATQDGADGPPIDPAWNRKLFTTLIKSWRRAWDNKELPFIYAQLPGLNRNWPTFRELQLKVAEDDPHAHLAVTIDVGHPTNVHPTDKQPVGCRLAEIARGKAASPKADVLSPTKIAFDGPVRTRDGQAVSGFMLAGKDRVFHPAQATIHGGSTIALKSDRVTEPVAVRYGWENDPKLNLVGAAGGHPVSPFRSDTWRMAMAEPLPATGSARGFTGFETPPAGGFTNLAIDGMKWSAPEGQAEILARLAKSGRQCLHLKGGEYSEAVLELDATLQFDRLTFAAERWTRRAPFRFHIEAEREGRWEEIYNGDQKVKVGRAYLNQVSVDLPKGARRFRFTSVSPPNAGVLIDELRFVEAKPMRITRVRVRKDTAPILIGQTNSPLLHVTVETEGALKALRVKQVRFEVLKGGDAIERTSFRALELQAGENVLTVGCQLRANASLDDTVSVRCTSIVLVDGTELPVKGDQSRKIGFALRQRGQDGINSYRIPGITTTEVGTLIAVYDNRNRGRGDLPGDIDVGMSRSTDGGQTWEPMKVIMDMGADPKWSYDGIGDPSILTDRVNGHIWVAATWSHGNRSWHGSGPGLKPEETGQLMLARSTDDGLTWSAPINITPQVKTNSAWRFVLQGPGNGITLRDGTLVFPAQFRGVNEEPVAGKPFSTILYSRDHGTTWKIGTGVKIDTTEAQIAQLADDSIMINCRDNRGGSRSVYTTKDLGATWQIHPTSRKSLPEPVCNAGLLRVEHPKSGPLLFFSNPNTTSGRHHFTIKVSRDEGLTWPARWHTLYDERPGGGYSVLTPVGADKIGVLYEGPGELYFLRYSIDDLLPRGSNN